MEPVVEEPKRLGRKLGLAVEDLDAGLGLLDHVMESDDNYQVSAQDICVPNSTVRDLQTCLPIDCSVQVEEEVSMSAEAFEDDEVIPECISRSSSEF